MDTLNTDYNSLSPEDKKVWVKAEMERKRNQFRNIDRKTLTNAGFDYDKLTHKQRDLILQPIDAPENYMHDGEISGDQAFTLWKKSLKNSGLTHEQIDQAVELNFG